MMLGSKDRYFALTLALSIVSVLVILAVLQYRWSTQVSDANEAQIGANLRSLMMDWHFDLFRDLSTVAVALQVGPDSGARDDWHDYLARYEEWQNAVDNPEIIENVYILDTSGSPEIRLLELDTDRRQILPAETPGYMRPLVARLKDNSGSLRAGLTAWNPKGIADPNEPGETSRRRHEDAITGWQFDADIPALVHPIVHHKLPGDQRTSRTSEIDWIIIRYNLEVLSSELLPRLAQRFFSGENGLDYRLEVVSTSHSGVKTIYSSEPPQGPHPLAQVDAEMGIFGVPPESTEGKLMVGPRSDSILRSPNWHNFASPSWFPVFTSNGEPPRWVLRVQHRRGSLAGIVAGVRRRNLAISFGVLVLLAVSMSLVVLATYRAQKYARLQMDFVAAVSHELRTPLAVISSAADNIADGVVTEKQLTKYGLAIRNQTRRLTDLVEDILRFAAARDGSHRYRSRIFDVSELVNTAIENTRALLERDGFTLQSEIEPKLPLVRGDISALGQCLENLIVNAIKYSGRSRWIGVRARTGRDHAGYLEVQITVEDRGPGIPAGEVEQIFEPFYRTQAARDGQIRGTGLGLTLARTIVEEMGGRLSVVTKVEQGSAFTVHLPPVLNPPSETETSPVSELSHKA